MTTLLFLPAGDAPYRWLRLAEDGGIAEGEQARKVPHRARPEPTGDPQGKIEGSSAGDRVEPGHAGTAQGDHRADGIDGVQKIPVETRTQHGDPGRTGMRPRQDIAVEGVKIRIGEGGGDSSGGTFRDLLTRGRQQDQGEARRLDADAPRSLRIDPFDAGLCQGGGRLARWHDTGRERETVLGPDQRDPGLRRPQSPARETGQQDRQDAPGLARGARQPREASRTGGGGEKQGVGIGVGAHSSSSPKVVSERAG